MGLELIGDDLSPSSGAGWWVVVVVGGLSSFRMFSQTDNSLFMILSPMSQKKNERKVREVEGRGKKYVIQMKRNKNDKKGNGFWWLVVIMCTNFGNIHSVDMRPYGCFINVFNNA